MSRYWYTQTSILETPFYMLASEKGLMFLGARLADKPSFIAEINGLFGIQEHELNELNEDDQRFLSYIEELRRFERGESISYERVILDLRGTDFQQSVWQSLLDIPFGEKTHYQAIAEMVDRPKAVRAVGGAIGANPILLFVPCHRVIGKNGTLTGFSAGLDLKVRWLEHEIK